MPRKKRLPSEAMPHISQALKAGADPRAMARVLLGQYKVKVCRKHKELLDRDQVAEIERSLRGHSSGAKGSVSVCPVCLMLGKHDKVSGRDSRRTAKGSLCPEHRGMLEIGQIRDIEKVFGHRPGCPACRGKHHDLTGEFV
ncbi:MAG: hypothetical protein ACXABY_01390 [Candidatus Thorarchaeota archaeon]|jgi:hypothetical protein